MKYKLILTTLNREGRTFVVTALYQEKKLVEAHLDPAGKKSILGNIYVGKVKDVVKNLNAAFIEIAPGKPCYYSLEDMKDPLFVKKGNSPRLVQGDELVVQVIQENSKSKPPKVSTNLNFSGRYLVLTSGKKSLGISRKLDEQTRERLRESLPFDTDDGFGVIIRTNAANATVEEVLEEYHQLKQEYLSLREKAPFRMAFSCLKESVPEYLHSIQGLDSTRLEAILTDNTELFAQIKSYLTSCQPKDLGMLTLYTDPLLSLDKLYSLEQKIQEALREKVWMRSGGYLVIQPTEALTVIDVNTGKSVAKKQVQEHHLKVNLEAAEEIAHQLRLRNISGIIIVDFIDMESEESKELLLQKLRQAVQLDSVPVRVLGMTHLNLVEMTRKKRRKSLYEQLTQGKN